MINSSVSFSKATQDHVTKQKSINQIKLEYTEHIQQVQAINGFWKNLRQSLPLGVLLMFYDFTTIHEVTSQKVTIYSFIQRTFEMYLI